MRIRSRIIIFVLIIIILFLGSGAEFFNNKNLGISFEDPEPDCYFVKKNNIYFNNVRVLSESNMRFIIRIIIG